MADNFVVAPDAPPGFVEMPPTVAQDAPPPGFQEFAPAPSGFQELTPQQAPIESVKSRTVEDLNQDKTFDPTTFAVAHPDIETDLQALEKNLEVYKQRNAPTTLWQKLANFTSFIKGAVNPVTVVPKAYEIGKTLVTSAKEALTSPVERASRIITDPSLSFEEKQTALAEEWVKDQAATVQSLETAATRDVELARKAVREVKEGALAPVAQAAKSIGEQLAPGLMKQLTGILGEVAKSKADMTPEDWQARYARDVAGRQAEQNASLGNGAVAEALKLSRADLEQAGITVDPEQIAKLSLVIDPINYIPMGGTVGAVSKVGGKLLTTTIAFTGTEALATKLAAAMNATRDLAQGAAAGLVSATGKAITGTANAAEGVLNPITEALHAGGIATAISGHHAAGASIYGARSGVRLIGKLGQGITRAGEIIDNPITAPEILKIAGTGLAAGAKGAVESLGLTIPFYIGASSPEEEASLQNLIALGAVTHGIGAAGGRVIGNTARSIQEKLATNLFKEADSATPPPDFRYGDDPMLDETSQQIYKKLPARSQMIFSIFKNLTKDSPVRVYALSPEEMKAHTGSEVAAGFAVDLGQQERVNPDGTTSPIVNIYLNGDAEALPHEAFHAFASLDPDGAHKFLKAVGDQVTPAQFQQFKAKYESWLNEGRPESTWTKQLSNEGTLEEIAAETFGRLWLSQDLTGVASPVRQQAALFLSNLLEKFGSSLGAFEQNPTEPGVSKLGVRPSAEATSQGRSWIADLTNRLRQGDPLLPPKIESPLSGAKIEKAPNLVAPATPITPENVRPITPGVPPTGAAPIKSARNIRVTRAKQNDFAAQRAEDLNIDATKKLASEQNDARIKQVVDQISGHMEKGDVLEIEHAGAFTTSSAEEPSGRTSRRAEQELAYVRENAGFAPENVREAYQKVFVPVRWENRGGKPQFIAMSLDKVLANIGKLAKELSAHKLEASVPYEIKDGNFTPEAWNQIVKDLQNYTQNQQNGYRGDGQKLARPGEEFQVSIPAENPSYVPIPIDEAKANFLNAIQGLHPPLTAKTQGKVPGNIKAQAVALANQRQPQVPTAIRPQDITKQVFPGGSERVMETNPLRNKLNAAGVPMRELIEVTERVNAKDVQSVKARPDLNFAAPVTDIVRGGFMPGTEISPGPNEEKIIPGFVGSVTSDGHVLGQKDKSWTITHDVLKLFPRGNRWRYEIGSNKIVWSDGIPVPEYQHAVENWLAKRGIENPSHIDLMDFGSLDGKLRVKGFFLPGPQVPEVAAVAEDYAKKTGIDYRAPVGYVPYDRELGKKLARTYDEALHHPDDPEVKKSYDAFKRETLDQWDAIKAAGIDLEPVTSVESPYRNGRDVAKDVSENKHLFFNLSESAFGTPGQGEVQLMLEPSGETAHGKELSYNDVFRAVHDFFGHAKEQFSFGPRGEFNAWREHAALYSPEAQGALGAETIGQTAWTQLKPSLLNAQGELLRPGEPGFVKRSERPYAEQKNFVMPEDLLHEARKVSEAPGQGEQLPNGRFLPEVTQSDTEPLRGGKAFAKFFHKTEKTPNGGSTFSTIKDVLFLSPKGFQPELDAYLKYGSNFQKHILTSIPAFVDARIRLMKGLENVAKDIGSEGKPVKMLDITSSEGYFTKGWAELSQKEGVKAEATALDALPAFKEAFDKGPHVPGVTFDLAAWGETFDDPTTGEHIPQFDPGAKKFDIVHEGMGFQFFTPDRENNLKTVKNLLTPDGVFVTLEKFKNPDYADREKLKDEFKSKFYTQDQLRAKAKQVLNSDANSVGMDAYQYDRAAYEKLLQQNFDHVAQIWSSGNFAGYVASDSLAHVQKIVDTMGSTDTKFSHEKTPRFLGRLPGVEQGAFQPDTVGYIGRISEDGVTAEKARLDKETHGDVFGPYEVGFKHWRYNPNFKKLFVWERLTPNEEEDIRHWLSKRGAKIEAVVPIRYESKSYDEAHGLSAEDRSIDRTNKYALPEVIRLGELFQGTAPDALELALANDHDAYRAVIQKFPELSTRSDWWKPVLSGVFGEPRPAGKFMLDDPSFKKEIEAVAKGKKDGETFNADGTIFKPGKKKLDVVTLASINVPLSTLSADQVKKFAEPYHEVLDQPGAKVGTFKMGPDTASIDLNAIVPQKFRQNSVKFAADNNQKSIFDMVKFDEVKTGGTGETALVTPAEIKPALQKLVKGQPVDISPYAKYERDVKQAEMKRRQGGGVKTENPLTSWILPNGEQVAVPTSHEKYLGEHAAELNKHFGTSFTPEADLEDRDAALHKGFVRVRFEPGRGTLHIEAGQKFWTTKRADQLRNLALDHSDSLDGIRISLFSANGNVTSQADSPNLFHLEGREKLDGINQTFEEVSRGGKFQPSEPTLLGLEDPTPKERVKARLDKFKRKFPEVLPPTYAKTDAGEFKTDEEGDIQPVPINYDLSKTPLAKEAASGLRGSAREDAMADAYARKLVQEAKTAAKNPALADGLKWYSTTRVRLRKLLGDDVGLFAQLLGATSPRTPPRLNFERAIDAYNTFKSGKHDAIIAKFREGKQKWESGDVADYMKATGDKEPTRAAFLNWWVDKNKLTPRTATGKLFGISSRAVLNVLEGSWLNETSGPKTVNFTKNLTGESSDATIDVWMGRLMRRLGYEGSDVARWRILPESETAVTDEDFALAQEAFRRAARKLDVRPDALQGMLWFAEKHLWEKNGWTRGQGAEKQGFAPLLNDVQMTPEGIKRIGQNPQVELSLGEVKGKQ